MKKRILSILLCLCMVACMLPTVAFAADTGKAIRLVNTNNPTGGILGYKNNNNSYDYIYMGSYNSSPVKWRVLDDQTNTGATGLFLLSEDLLGSGGHGDVYDVYFDGTSPYSNAWQGSDAQGWCNTFESSNLDSRELAAILSTTKSDEAFTSSTHNASFAASTNILNSDQVFFLSAQEAENGQYGFTDEAARVANYGAYASVWWLRSPFAKFTSSAGAVDGFGRVYDCGVGIVWAARPAFNLNLNSVLFTSAAVGGKPDGGLTAVPEYSGNEWKLTLLDSSRNFAVTEKAVSADPNDTITLNYSGATTGANEYISAIIADNNGAQYYGRVAQPTAESGTVEIKIPSDIAPGNYTLKVFSEQYNGDYKTDYASNFTDIALTVEKQVEEQFSLTPGGRYYFDLSAMNIPGTANGGNSDGAVSLPDTTLHYVPFTYVGTIEAYKLTSEMATTEEYAQQNKYPHSLFVADYAVTHTISWGGLNDEGLIFGKNYASGGVDYTLRAPSVGSNSTGSGESQHDTPSNNEWDRILDKNSGYIQNWNKMYSWGQDTSSAAESFRAYRGYNSARFWYYTSSSFRNVYLGFRPVLEVLNPGTLGSDGLKVVTLDLGGGKLGNSSEDIQIIVKSGESFTAPASDGLTRPDGDTDTYFMWLGSDGKLYAPGDRVPADVTALTVQWTAPTYAVTLNTNGGTINNGNVTGYTYGVGAKLPTADDLTYTGYTFKGWYDNENLTGSPVTAIGGTETGNKEYWAKWEINQYTITFDTNGGSEIAPITQDYGTKITTPADPTRKGYTFKGWDKEIPKTMPAENITVKAQWEINQYAITFDTNGGSEIAPITQNYGTKITAPADPTRKGYTFKGWDKEIPKTMPAENITVKAQWEINQYAITFDTNGGSEIAPITQDYGTAITAPADPTRKGYTFKGWDKEIPKTMPAENITVKAQWEINQYTITFDTNGGSEIAPITQDYGTKITTPADPTRKGYTFKGWDKEIPKTMPAENITVKAQWEINQYTITFDTNGGSEIAPITQDYGTAITAPADPTRKGYTFKGWDKEIPKTMPAENITVKAQWEINQYAITFDTNGGSEIAPITQDYGTAITAPADPTRKGYTFKGWDKEIPKTMPAENITVKAQWEINQYTITFDTNGGSEIAPITQNYGTKITAPDNPTRKGYTFKGWDKEIPKTMPAENITITARWRDTEKPTGEIIIGTNKWNKFLNELTFGIFFKDTQEVTINAVDNSGTVFVSYLVTDKELSEAELDSLVFRAYEEPFCIDPNGEYIVYVMLVDENINITYLRSDRLTLDNIHPVIGGIENGKTYCEAQTVTVDEKYVDTVTVNGKAATLDENNSFTLAPADGEQKIVVTDKAGNNAEMTVTVNNGHTFGEWVSDNDGTHTRKCTVDGCNAFETENCSGGNATCTKKAVCDVCGKAYGELDKTNHEGGVQEWTTRTAFVHEQKWNCCGAVIVTSEVHEWKDGVCRECGYVCPHNDADKNHICDYCKKTISTYENAATEEIKNADTVTAKLPDDSKSPQTGDNSNIILWIALLIISGGVIQGVTAFGKSKKHSAKIKDK